MNSLDFLQKKNESPDVRVHKAQELLENHQLSIDTVMKWLSRSFSNVDQSFKLSKPAWELFKKVLLDEDFKADRFTIYMKPTNLLPVYQSDFHQEAFETIEILVKNYPDAWRPDYCNLMEFISKMITSKVVHKYEISLMMEILLDKPEVTAAIDSVYDNAKKILFKPILQNIKKLDEELSLNLLSTLLCVPFFVRKACDAKSQLLKEFISTLNEFPEASSLFAPYLMQNFVKQMDLLNNSLNLSFPLEIIDHCDDLIIAAPLIRECNKLKMYKQKKDSEELPRLQNITKRSIQDKRSDVLVELTLIDFRSVRPFLNLILQNKEIATSELSVVILEQCFKLKDPMMLFEIGNFPSHILSYPNFIHQFCYLISHLISTQLLLILNHLIGYSNRLEESCLLFWSIKSGHLTQEFEEIVDSLLLDCFSNPWRFAAATIAAKRLQKQLPPPLDIVKDSTTHPIILECFLCENYGMIEFKDDQEIDKIIDKNDQVPEIPSPYMKNENSTIYRFAFIIKNLSFFGQSITIEKLTEIISFVISNSIFASNLENPNTIADYCLNLIYNSAFYESNEIRTAFINAAIPLLPSHHLNSLEPHSASIYQFYHSVIISALPSEFLTQKVSTAAFVGLFLTFEGNEKMELPSESISELKLSPVFDEIYNSETLVNCICNAAENMSKTFVKHNLIRIFSNCTDDSAIRLIPILFDYLITDGSNKQFEFPDIEINRPSQLISVCDFCYEHDIPLPFEYTLFDNDFESFCAQLRIGHSSTISLLLESKEFEPKESQMIIMALNDIKNKNEEDYFLDSKFPQELIKHLIDSMVRNEKDFVDRRVVSQFCSRLSINSVLYFLDSAPLFYYPWIFSALNITREEFTQFEKFIIKLLRPEKHSENIEIKILKEMCSIKLSHIYSTTIVSRLLFLITSENIRISKSLNNNIDCSCLPEICLLCQTVVQLINNCNKEISKKSINTIEIVRKISSLFCHAISKESPSYKQLKQFAKMFAAVAKVAFQDQLPDLIASFVSHLTLYKPDDKEQLKMKSLQTSVFPLFNRCSKEQLNKVLASLHDSHKEVFKKLNERWTNEAQYKGKV